MNSVYLEWSVASATMPGERESGDCYLACAMPDGMLFAVVDGLGHGSEAAVASCAAVATLEQHAGEPMVTLLTRCHEALRCTRGAAMSLVAFNTHDATVTWIGVGNVEGVLLRANPQAPNERLLLRSGVVGSHLPILHAADLRVDPGDLFVFATDGVANDFMQDLDIGANLDLAAQHVLAKANKGIDDALVLLVRYRGRAMKEPGAPIPDVAESLSAADYLSSLQNYLQGAGEAALQQAYEIGRKAITAGTGLLAIAQIHHASLEVLLQQDATAQERSRIMKSAAEFFAECISPYEMTYSGFREANIALRHFNELLEQEAKRIAHALHDEAGQLLVAVYIALQDTAQHVPQAGSYVSKAIQLLDQIETQLRRLAHELAPALLNDLGLVPALRYLSDGLAQRTRLQINIEDLPGERLPRVIEATLYRVAKESLHNVLRHAQATAVTIEFRRTPAAIYCHISDDGVGFNPQAIDARQGEQGFGLIGIRERLGVLGGTLQINSAVGSGTELVMVIPVEPEMSIRIVLADDHLIVRQGLRLLLEKELFQLVGEASDGHEAIRLIEEQQPDVAVLDLEMPRLDGFGVLRELARISPKTRSIILTRHMEEPYAVEALRAGARGYVLKTQAGLDLVAAVQHVHRGEVYLSPKISKAVVDAYLSKTELPNKTLTARERQVLQLVGEGHSTKEIAVLLGISAKTADTHRTKVMEKLDIHQTAGLVRYAIRSGLIEP